MPEFYSKIVGVTFDDTDGSKRQDIIEDLEDQLRLSGSAPLQLKRDPKNPFDANAVMVLDSQKRQLGYLRKQVSQTIAPIIDQDINVLCTVAQITGQDLRQNFGINIKISY